MFLNKRSLSNRKCIKFSDLPNKLKNSAKYQDKLIADPNQLDTNSRTSST